MGQVGFHLRKKTTRSESIYQTQRIKSSLGCTCTLSNITAFFFLLAGFDSTGEEPFAACCLFLSIGCLAMLANSEGRVGVTILRIIGILIFFGIVFSIILNSMMSGGWGGMGVGGLSGWGGP